MKDQRLILVRSGGRSPAEERAWAWDALRAALLRGAGGQTSEEEIAIEAATCELRRAAPSLRSWNVPERPGEPQPADAVWARAVLVWGATVGLVAGLLAGVVQVLARG